MSANACGAARHDSERAYRDHGCRCPRAVEIMRRLWHRRGTRIGMRANRTRGWRNGGDVDRVAVLRACLGDRTVRLTAAERQAAIAALTGRGMSGRAFADRLGCCERTVVRWRHRMAVELTQAAA